MNRHRLCIYIYISNEDLSHDHFKISLHSSQSFLISFSDIQQGGTNGAIGPPVPPHAEVGSKKDDEHVTRNQVTCIIIRQPVKLVQAITSNNECVTRSIVKVSTSILIMSVMNHVNRCAILEKLLI